MTVKQSETPIGRRLLHYILDMCHDGELILKEVDEFYQFLRYDSSDIPAIPWLRAIVREIILDGEISEPEAVRLKRAFMRIVPKEIRGVIATHLEQLGIPAVDDDAEPAGWHNDDATAKQIEYILALGGQVSEGMTKGQAGRLIDALLERRPVTPRQQMLLRFFDRLDLSSSTKDEVMEWIDHFFFEDLNREIAWRRFKQETGMTADEIDPEVVPVGAFVQYMRSR
jgi:hypothetical protein